MTPEELHDDMIAHTDFDDAYVEVTATAFDAMSTEDMHKFMLRLAEAQKTYSPDQKHTLQRLNLALASKPAFNAALKRYSEWREKQPRTEDAP